MQPYSILSTIYDFSRSTENILRWADYVIELIEENNLKRGSKILDCGCGTGDIGIELAKKGFRVDSIDISSEMLIVAKEKSHNLGLSINYTLQDMRTFKSHHLYDAIICINDGVNYLTNLEDVKAFFSHVHNKLEKDGLFIFDVSSRNKLKNMNNEFFTEETEELSYIWSNEYDEKTNCLKMDLTFFTLVENDIYKKLNEVHTQRAHTVEELEELLIASGYEIVGIYDNLSKNYHKKTSTRIQFVVKKN